MKRYLSIFLALVLVFNFTMLSFSYADVIDNLKNVGLGEQPDFASEISIDGTELSQPSDPSAFSFGGIIGTILGGFLGIFDLLSPVILTLAFILPTIDGCIFNTQDFFRLSFFEGTSTGLSGSIQGSISAIYNAFRYLVTAAYIVTLVYLAIRMMLSSVGRQKAKYKELFKHWFIGLLLLFSFHWVMAFIIWLSNTFVEIFATLAANILESTDESTISAINLLPSEAFANKPITGFVASRITSTGLSGGLIAVLGALKPIIGPTLAILLIASAFGVIMTYFKRLFTIAILILTFPLVALSYVFDKIGDRKAQTLSIWLKEFVVNVMIQPIHAIILVFIALLFSTGNTPASGVGDFFLNGGLFGPHLIGAIMSLLALRLIPVGEDLLKKLFQINSTMGPGAKGIAGEMAKTGMALQGMKNIKDGLKKSGTALSALNQRRKFGNDLWKKSDEYKNSPKGLKNAAANRAAKAEFLKKNKAAKEAYDKYTDGMCASLGVKSLGDAKKLGATQLAGMAAGVGSAITGAPPGRFLSEAASRAVMGSDILSTAALPFLKAPPKDSRDYEDRAKGISGLSKDQIDGLSKDEKKKIAAELNIDWKQVTGGNKDNIAKAYSAMAVGAKYGMSKDAIQALNPFHIAQENIKKGKMPDGSGDLDITQFDKISQTRDGMFGEYNGMKLKISNKGNRSLGEDEEFSVPDDAIGGSVKSISTHKQKAEYVRLENEHSTKVAELSTAEAVLDRCETEKVKVTEEYRDAKTARSVAKSDSEAADRIARDADDALTNAKQIYDDNPTQANKLAVETAQIRFETAVERSQDRQSRFEVADNNFRETEQRFEAVTQSYSEASRTVSTVRSEEKRLQSELRTLDEKAQKQAYAFEKEVMANGGDVMFTETAIQTAMNPDHIDNSSFSRTSSGVYVNLNNSSGGTNTYKMNDVGGSDFSISATRIGSVAFDQAQIDFGTAFVNGDSSGMTAAENTLENIQTIQGALNNFNSGTIVPNQVESAFSFGTCAGLSNVLDDNNWKEKGYTINLTRTTESTLNYVICTRTGRSDGLPHGSIPIDSHFNCDSLRTIGDSITIVTGKGLDGKLTWFIQK